MNLPRALRMFDNTTNTSPAYPTNAGSDQKSAGALTHISKVPTPPIDTYFNPSNYVHRSAIDTAYEQKNSNGSRKFGIYPSAAKNTFVYEASISSKSDFYDDGDSFYSAPDDASVLARSSLETLQSVFGVGYDGSDSDGSDHSPSRIIPPNLPALIEAQKNYNAGVISVALPDGVVVLSFVARSFFSKILSATQARYHQIPTPIAPLQKAPTTARILPLMPCKDITQ